MAGRGVRRSVATPTLVLLALLAWPVRSQIMDVSDKHGRFVDTSADLWHATTPSTKPASLKITKPVGIGLTPDAMRDIVADVGMCELKSESVDHIVSPNMYALSVVAGSGCGTDQSYQ